MLYGAETYGYGTFGPLIEDTWAETLAPDGYTSPMRIEIYYSGAWHDITADVNELDGITITRGRQNEGKQPDPARCNLTLRNPAGTYSPRNPNSALYGLIGRNTPIRVLAYVGGAWNQRFQGEVGAWPQKWGTKGSTQSMAPIECAGIMRRLGQGASPVRSPLYRGITSIGPNLVAYWPCEDEPGSSTIQAAVGGRDGQITGSPALGAYDGMAASGQLPNIGSGRLALDVPAYASTDAIQARFVAVFPSGGLPDGAILARVRTGNSLGWWDLIYTTASSGSLQLQPYTNLGVATAATGAVAYGLNGNSYRIDMEAVKNGAGIDFTMVALAIGAGSAVIGTCNVASATLGPCTRVEINPDGAALTDFMAGHVSVEKAITTVFDLQSQSIAYAGERATSRILRLCAENGISLGGTTDDGESPRLGAQGKGTLADLLNEAADTGRGILVDRRSADGLFYVPFSSICAVTAWTAAIPYTGNLLIPFEPVDDDASTRNKVTVTRSGGAAATVEDTTSPLSTAPAPNGVGVYDEAVALPLADDIAARHHAGWLVHMGTVNEARYPQIGVDLAHPTIKADSTLRASLLTLVPGSRLDVTSLPSWLPPDDVQAVVQGYTERITARHWTIVFNCTPYRPYRAARYTSTGITDRYSNENTTLGASLTSTAASLTASFSAGPAWTVADGSYDVMVAGERMTVTAITGTSSPQTWTVTRSVNGVVKAHTSGEAITLADPVYYGI